MRDSGREMKKLYRKMRMLAKIIVHFCHDVGVYDSSFSTAGCSRSSHCLTQRRTVLMHRTFMFDIYSMRHLCRKKPLLSGIIVALLTFAFVSHFE